MLARYYRAGDLTGLYGLLSEDVEVVLPGGDTIRGRGGIAAEGLLGGTEGRPPQLVRGELWFCHGGPQEYGYFEMPHPQTGTTQTGGYQLQWSPERTGWRVRRLVLTLPTEYAAVRRRSCEGAQEVAFLERRWSIGLYPPWTSAAVQSANTMISDAMRRAGWGDREPVLTYPRERTSSLPPAAEVSYRLSPQVSVRAFGVGPMEGSVDGFRAGTGRARLTYTQHSLGVAIGYHLRLLRLDAGVLVANTNWGWKAVPRWEAEPVDWSSLTIGYVLGPTVTLPLAERFGVMVSLQHRGVRAPDLPSYRGVGSAPARLDHTQALVGISIRH